MKGGAGRCVKERLMRKEVGKRDVEEEMRKFVIVKKD